MKDAIPASEWAERWPGARGAGFHPSSAPLSLQPCPLDACLPTCKFRSWARWPLASWNVGEQRNPWICSRVVWGKQKQTCWVGWGRCSGWWTLQLVSKLSHLHFNRRWPLSLAHHHPLGRVKLSADPTHARLLRSFLLVTMQNSMCWDIACGRADGPLPCCLREPGRAGTYEEMEICLPRSTVLSSCRTLRCTRLRPTADTAGKLVWTEAFISRGHLALLYPTSIPANVAGWYVDAQSPSPRVSEIEVPFERV